MAAMWQNDWATSIDLKNVYFHIPMAKEVTEISTLCGQWHSVSVSGSAIWVIEVQLVYTGIMNKIAAYAHQKGLQLYVYLGNCFSGHWMHSSSSRTPSSYWIYVPSWV